MLDIGCSWWALGAKMQKNDYVSRLMLLKFFIQFEKQFIVIVVDYASAFWSRMTGVSSITTVIYSESHMSHRSVEWGQPWWQHGQFVFVNVIGPIQSELVLKNI